MDETVYQCPECNYNADNISDLDSHIAELHSNDHHIKSSNLNLQDNDLLHGDEDEDVVDENQHHHEHYHDEEDDEFAHQNEYFDDEFDDDDVKDEILPQQQQQQQQQQPAKKQANKSSFDQQQLMQMHPLSSMTMAALSVPNTDNHYERQYTCKRCGFSTNNPRAVLYHRKEYHNEKINVHECAYCQYASQYSGKVERHTLLRHKIEMNTPSSAKKQQQQQPQVKKQPATPQTTTATTDNEKVATRSSTGTSPVRQQPQRAAATAPKMPLNLNTLFAKEDNNKSSPVADGGDAKFQCNKCPCKYKRSHDLYRHMRTKHGLESSQISEYVKTLAVGSDEPSLSIVEDDDNTTSDLLLNENTMESGVGADDQVIALVESPSKPKSPAKQPAKYECPYCVYTVSSSDRSKHAEYVAHVKDHLCGKTFRCVLCNSVYKYRGDCVVHLKRKHQKADMVAQNYVERFNLDAMMDDLGKVVQILKPKQTDELESEEKLFGCSYCDYKANYKGDVYKHQTRRHPGTVKSVNVLKSNVTNKNGFHVPSVIIKHSSSSSNPNNTTASSTSSSLSSSYYMNQSANSNVSASPFNNANSRRSAPPVITPVVKQQQHVQQQPQHEDTTFDDQDNFYDEQVDDEYFIDDNNEEQDMIDYDDMDQQQQQQYQDEEKDEEQQQPFVNNDEFNEDGGDEMLDQQQEDEPFFDDEFEQPLEDDEQQPHEQVVHEPTAPAAAASACGGFRCQLCPYVGKSRVKLELHMSTHANLKQYMCPICKRRSNFKWDIQKHMRKIHQNFSNDVICLNVESARKEQQQQLLLQQQQSRLQQQLQQPTQPGVKLALTKHARRERKFKCSLCNRTSKWQWDIRKHMRTVHKGRDGDVIVLKDKELIRRLTEDPRRSLGSNGTLVEKPNLYSSQQQVARTQQQQQQPPKLIRPLEKPSLPAPPSLIAGGGGGGGTDSTGNKKFKCSLCPYRSNWKADLYKHIRKHHMIEQPTTNDIVVLDASKAAATIEEYERTYGALIRKRSKVDMDEMKAAAASTLDASSTYDDEPSAKRFHYDDEDDDEELLDEGDDDEEMDSDFLLSIKRYECAECALRTCKRAEVLVHIREKHPDLQQQEQQLIRVFSVEQAAESIEQYENARLCQQVKQFARDEMMYDEDDEEQENLTNGLNGHHHDELPPNGQTTTSRPITRSLSSPIKCVASNVVTTSPEHQSYFRCPFCSFKHASNILMRRHLLIHYESKKNPTLKKPPAAEQPVAAPAPAPAPAPAQVNGTTVAAVAAPPKQQVYRCNLCSFKSQWHHIVRKHVITSHFSSSQAQVAKQLSSPPPLKQAPQLTNGHNGHHHHHQNGGSRHLNGGGNNNRRTDSGTSSSGSSSLSTTSLHNSSMNNNKSSNNNNNTSLKDDDYDDVEKSVETIALTGNDGQKFTTSFLVYNPPPQQFNGGLPGKKKMYFCQTCPYKTNNYCNLKQHLIQHRYMAGYYKCRFCSYYVSMTRLLKQHEILHPEYHHGSESNGGDLSKTLKSDFADNDHHHVEGINHHHHHKDLDLLTNNNSEIISSY